MSESDTLLRRRYIFADDRTENRLAVVRIAEYSMAGYILRTGGGWMIEDDRSKLVYQNRDEAAALVYMRGRAYLRSYGVNENQSTYRIPENPLKKLSMVVTRVEGEWLSSIRRSEHPYERVVADISSPSLEEAKLDALCRSHALLFENQKEMRPIFRPYAQEMWSDIQLSECSELQ